MHQALPPPLPPIKNRSHILLPYEIFPLPPRCVVGLLYCPPPPCGVVGVWYGMLGMYGVMVGLVWHVWKVWYVWYVW